MAIEAKDGTFFLFTNETANGNSPAMIVKYPNKTAIIKVWGTWAGADIKFQTLAPSSSPEVWLDIPNTLGNTEFTQDGQATLLYLVQNEQIRAVL